VGLERAQLTNDFEPAFSRHFEIGYYDVEIPGSGSGYPFIASPNRFNGVSLDLKQVPQGGRHCVVVLND
jgi:hypothetical protein